MLVTKALDACDRYGVPRLLLGGGVAGAQFGAALGTRLRGEETRALLGLMVLGVAASLLGTARSVWLGGVVTLFVVGVTAYLAPELRAMNLDDVPEGDGRAMDLEGAGTPT